MLSRQFALFSVGMSMRQPESPPCRLLTCPIRAITFNLFVPVRLGKLPSMRLEARSGYAHSCSSHVLQCLKPIPALICETADRTIANNILTEKRASEVCACLPHCTSTNWPAVWYKLLGFMPTDQGWNKQYEPGFDPRVSLCSNTMRRVQSISN